MTKTFETLQNSAAELTTDEQLDLEREQFIEDNALAALRLELAGLAVKAANTISPESFND
jgi:hypothetical protein